MLVSLLVTAEVQNRYQQIIGPTTMLTDATIKAMKAQEKPYKKADREGLYVLVRPNGSKLWQQSYRFAGKQKVILSAILAALLF